MLQSTVRMLIEAEARLVCVDRISGTILKALAMKVNIFQLPRIQAGLKMARLFFKMYACVIVTAAIGSKKPKFYF